jgi:hypothetical protein
MALRQQLRRPAVDTTSAFRQDSYSIGPSEIKEMGRDPVNLRRELLGSAFGNETMAGSLRQDNVLPFIFQIWIHAIPASVS